MELAGLVALGAIAFYGWAVYLALRLLLSLREAGGNVARESAIDGNSLDDNARAFRSQ